MPRAQVRASRRPQERVRILVVEDEDMLREFVCECLTGEGYEVIAASSGEEAVRILEAGTRPFQLLITDLVLRGIGGQEVVDHLRSTEPGTKAIFMSGYAGGRTSSSSLRQSGLAYLQKPFTPVDLARQVRASLEARPRPPVRKPKGRSRKPKSP